MGLSWWLVSVPFGVILAVLFCIAFVPRFQRGMVQREASEVGLAVPPDLVEVVHSRLVFRSRVAFVAVAVGVTGILLLWPLALSSDAAIPSDFLGLPIVISITLVSVVTLTSHRAYGPGDSTPGHHLPVGSYLAPQIRIVATVSAVWAFGAVLWCWIVLVDFGVEKGRVALAALPTVSVLVLSVVVLALAPVAVRRVRHSDNNQHQAWNHAITAQALFYSYTSVTLILLISVNQLFSSATSAVSDIPDHGTPLEAMAPILGVTIGLMLAYVATIAVRSPRKHYLRTIWPNARDFRYGTDVLAGLGPAAATPSVPATIADKS